MRLEALTQAQIEERGEALGAVLRSGDVVLLEGPMGAGKTTFTRALARGLGIARPDRVRSPTFNICLIHEGPVPLVHVDLFRLADEGHEAVGAAAFEALGLEALADRLRWPHAAPEEEGGVLVIEWANLWAHELGEHLSVHLAMSEEAQRRDLWATAVGERHQTRLSAWQSS